MTPYEGTDFWQHLYYIRLSEGTKHPRQEWGGYDQDFADAENVLTWDDLHSDGYYGYIAHDEYRLGVIDLDMYKDHAADSSDVSYHSGNMVIKSPSGGIHLPFLIPDGEIALQVRPKFTDWIDLKGEINKGHVVFPYNSDYNIVQDGLVRLYSPQAGEHTDIAKVRGEGILETVHRTSGTFEGESPYGEIYESFLVEANYPPGERRPHPIHGSDTGNNFMVDENRHTWRCWRHETTGNLLHLAGLELGILDCGEWDNKSYEDLHPKYEQVRRQAFQQLGLQLDPNQNYTAVLTGMPEEY